MVSLVGTTTSETVVERPQHFGVIFQKEKGHSSHCYSRNKKNLSRKNRQSLNTVKSHYMQSAHTHSDKISVLYLCTARGVKGREPSAATSHFIPFTCSNIVVLSHKVTFEWNKIALYPCILSHHKGHSTEMHKFHVPAVKKINLTLIF